MTARAVRPATPTQTLCRDGLLCDQPATYLITAVGLADPQYRCVNDLGIAIDCIAESLAEAGHEAEVRVTRITTTNGS